MGNASYRFLISFFGLTLTIILVANLMIYGQLGFFGDMEATQNSYFGFSSFNKSWTTLEVMMGTYNLNGFFSMDSFNKAITGLLNSAVLNIPKVYQKIITTDIFVEFASYIPNMPSWGSISDLSSFFTYFLDWAKYIVNLIYYFFKAWVNSNDMLVAYLQILTSPAQFILYSLWILSFIIYWVVVVLMWIGMLMRGYITEPMPSSNSQWVSIVDGWQDQWDNMTSSSAKVFFAPLASLVHRGARGEILATYII